MLRSAPFETPPAAAPQDKGARLEAHTASLQLFFHSASNFLSASKAGIHSSANAGDSAIAKPP
jgi:hypothetical protein